MEDYITQLKKVINLRKIYKQYSYFEWQQIVANVVRSDQFIKYGFHNDIQLSLSSYDMSEAQSCHLIIRNTNLSVSQEDLIVLIPSPYGESQRLSSSSDFVSVWPNFIWNNNIPSKIHVFQWLAIQGFILVKLVHCQRARSRS